MNPQDAFKLKGKKGDLYFKFWMASDHLMFCTWANTMIDDYFNWKKNERLSCIGWYKDIWGYLDSNDYINNAKEVYVIAYADMPKVEELRNERNNAKKNAYALLKTKDIKAANIKKYKELIAKMGFSSGSEFDLLQNVIKPLNNIPYDGFFDAIIETNLLGDIRSYLDAMIVKMIELEKIDFNPSGEELNNIFGEFHSLSRNAKDIIESSKKAKIFSPSVQKDYEKARSINNSFVNQYIAYASGIKSMLLKIFNKPDFNSYIAEPLFKLLSSIENNRVIRESIDYVENYIGYDDVKPIVSQRKIQRIENEAKRCIAIFKMIVSLT